MKPPRKSDLELPRRGGSYIRRKDGSLAPNDAANAVADRLNFDQAVDETLRDERYSASAVFDRMREALGCESDAALAWVFGTSPQNISNRRKRNSVPYREAIYVAIWSKSSLEYILTGVGKLEDSNQLRSSSGDGTKGL